MLDKCNTPIQPFIFPNEIAFSNARAAKISRACAQQGVILSPSFNFYDCGVCRRPDGTDPLKDDQFGAVTE